MQLRICLQARGAPCGARCGASPVSHLVGASPQGCERGYGLIGARGFFSGLLSRVFCFLEFLWRLQSPQA